MRKLLNNLRLAWKLGVAVFLTLLRVRRTRRKMMFWVSLAAMLSAFLGFTLLDNFLTDHPLLFAIFWFFCIGLVFFMLLLAIYDFAAVRGELNTHSDEELAEILKKIERSAREQKPTDGEEGDK